MTARTGYTARRSWDRLVHSPAESGTGRGVGSIPVYLPTHPMEGWRAEEQALAVTALLVYGVDPSEFTEGGSPEWGPSALVWMSHFAISPTRAGFVLDSDDARAASLPEYPSAVEAVLAYFRGDLR